MRIHRRGLEREYAIVQQEMQGREIDRKLNPEEKFKVRQGHETHIARSKQQALARFGHYTRLYLDIALGNGNMYVFQEGSINHTPETAEQRAIYFQKGEITDIPSTVEVQKTQEERKKREEIEARKAEFQRKKWEFAGRITVLAQFLPGIGMHDEAVRARDGAYRAFHAPKTYHVPQTTEIPGGNIYPAPSRKPQNRVLHQCLTQAERDLKVLAQLRSGKVNAEILGGKDPEELEGFYAGKVQEWTLLLTTFGLSEEYVAMQIRVNKANKKKVL